MRKIDVKFVLAIILIFFVLRLSRGADVIDIVFTALLISILFITGRLVNRNEDSR